MYSALHIRDLANGSEIFFGKPKQRAASNAATYFEKVQIRVR